MIRHAGMFDFCPKKLHIRHRMTYAFGHDRCVCKSDFVNIPHFNSSQMRPLISIYTYVFLCVFVHEPLFRMYEDER
jgi:hypothetical protein